MIFDELNWNYRLMYWTYYLMKILRLPLRDLNHLKLKNCFCKIKKKSYFKRILYEKINSHSKGFAP